MLNVSRIINLSTVLGSRVLNPSGILLISATFWVNSQVLNPPGFTKRSRVSGPRVLNTAGIINLSTVLGS